MPVTTHISSPSGLSGAEWAFTIMMGVFISTVFMMAVLYALSFKTLSSGSGATSKSQQSEKRLLFVAEDDDFKFRALSIGIAPKTRLHQTIMFDVGQSAKQLHAEARKRTSSMVQAVITYTNTAQAGPVTSLMRQENIIDANGQTNIRTGSSLANRFKPVFNLEDLFLADKANFKSLRQTVCKSASPITDQTSSRTLKKLCASKKSVFEFGPWILEPSNRPNMFGGMTLIKTDPDTKITLNQERFRNLLKPEYRGLFGGHVKD